MKNKKLCVSKKNLYLILSLVMFFSFVVVVSSYLSKTKSVLQSKATEVQNPNLAPQPMITPYPTTPLTSDPKKILKYWIEKELAHYPSTRDYTDEESKKTYALIGRDGEFMGEFDQTKNKLEGAMFCFLSSENYYGPIQMISTQAGKYGGTSTNEKLAGLSTSKNNKLAFYRNKSNGEIDAYISSWSGNTYYALKRIPYQAFLRAFSPEFSKDIRSRNNPLTSKTGMGPREDGCTPFGKSTNYESWIQWAYNVITYRGIYDIPGSPHEILTRLTPIPTAYVAVEPTKTPIEQKIANFNVDFVSAYGGLFQETVIGPFVYKSKFRTHVDYYLDGGQKASPWSLQREGSYTVMRDWMKKLAQQYPEGILSFDELEMDPGIKNPPPAHVIDSKTFINYYRSNCTGPNSYPQFNCPLIDRAGLGLLSLSSYTFNKDNTFVIHFKPLQTITFPNKNLDDTYMDMLIFVAN